MMTSVDQDTIYQYFDGRDLLNAILAERMQLLQNLEQLVKGSQETSHPDEIVEFPLVKAQLLLYKLSAINEDIATLVGEINRYAERSGNPRFKIIKRRLQ